MKAFKMACLQYKPSPVSFENQTYKRQELIGNKNTLLKYCLSQLKHLDLGIMEGREQSPRGVLGLEAAWNNIQMNQENEGANYAELDPRQLPSWDNGVVTGTRNSSAYGRDPDWLN